MPESIIAGKTYTFSIRIVNLFLSLSQSRNDIKNISSQLLRSGTSIGANVEEAIGGYSEKDFAAKMSIAYKEARETRYWIQLFKDCNILDKELSQSFLNDIEEIIRILGSIIRTVKNKNKGK